MVRGITKDVPVGVGTSTTRGRNLGLSVTSSKGRTDTHRGITTGRVTRLNAQPQADGSRAGKCLMAEYQTDPVLASHRVL